MTCSRYLEYIILGPSLTISARLIELIALLFCCYIDSTSSSLFIIV
jgi:hypothetical protein